jgi:hypothetical protein
MCPPLILTDNLTASNALTVHRCDRAAYRISEKEVVVRSTRLPFETDFGALFKQAWNMRRPGDRFFLAPIFV